jgi:hypothetical protein
LRFENISAKDQAIQVIRSAPGVPLSAKDINAEAQSFQMLGDNPAAAIEKLAENHGSYPRRKFGSPSSTLFGFLRGRGRSPGTLIESSGYLHGNDALKWKDIELYMVTHPDCPTSQVLLMRVRHRLNKGRRNEGVP